jgi:hypothetical protein
MTFFNFSPGSAVSGENVSKWLWVYFAITVPLTLVIYSAWRLFVRKRTDDKDEESGIDLKSIEQGSQKNENLFWGLGYWDPVNLMLADGENMWR